MANSSGLSLATDSYSGYAPTHCYHEDVSHNRFWLGTMSTSGVLQVTLPFCAWTPADPFLNPGADGFLMKVSGNGEFTLTATSPSGVVYSAHVLEQSNRSETSARCFVRPTSGSTIEGGTWTVTLTNVGAGDARNTGLQVWVNMAWDSWQQAVCPSVDWVLLTPGL